MRIDEEEKECADIFLLQFYLRVSNSNNNNKIRSQRDITVGRLLRHIHSQPEYDPWHSKGINLVN